MAFEKLQALGEDQFGKILNLLMRGEPAMTLARTIQQPPPQGWGLFQDVAEKTLTQQLNRLRLAAAEGAFGLQRARRIAAGYTPQIRALENVSVQALVRLEELSDVLKARMLGLIEKEKALSHVMAGMTEVSKDYRQTLLDIQKVRFDLGLDEFKGPVGTTVTRGATQSTSFPDGTSVQRQVFEAVTTMEQIFKARNIPQISD